MSQLLTSLLTVIGVLRDDGRHLAAARGRSRSSRCRSRVVITAVIGERRQQQFVAQWRSTSAQLNGQIEEAFTGHALVKVFGRQREVEARFGAKNEELFDASVRRSVRVEHHHAGDRCSSGTSTIVAIAVVGGLRVASGAMTHRRRAGVHPVLAPVHPAADAGGVDGQRAAVRRRLARSASSSCSTRPSRSPDRGAAAPSIARGRGEVRFEHVVVPLRPGRAADRGPVARRRARPDGGDRRADRCRQDHAGQPDHAVLRARRRPHHARRRRHRASCRAPRPAVEDRHGAAGHLAVRRHDPRQHRLRQSRRDRGADLAARRRPPTSTASCAAFPTVTTPSSTRRAATSAPARSSCITIARAFLADPSIADPRRGDHRRSTPAPRCSSSTRWRRCASDRTELRHRPPPVDDPRRRPDPRHGAAARSSSRASTSSCSAADGAYFRLYNAQFAASAVDLDSDDAAARVPSSGARAHSADLTSRRAVTNLRRYNHA